MPKVHSLENKRRQSVFNVQFYFVLFFSLPEVGPDQQCQRGV